MHAATPQTHRTRRPSLDNCPAEILLEIANNLEIDDFKVTIGTFRSFRKYSVLIRFRSPEQTSKYLNEFSYTHAIWATAAQRIAYHHPLNLPSSRPTADCSVDELSRAAFRATKLHQILRGQNQDTKISPKGPIDIVHPPSLNDAGIRLLPGGRYFSFTTPTRYALWDSHLQRSIGEIAKEGYMFVDNRILIISETSDLTRFIVACCLRLDGPEIGKVTFSIFEIKYPSLDSQLPAASVDELLSRSIKTERSALYLDDRIAAVAGPSSKQGGAHMRVVISVVDLATLKMSFIRTRIVTSLNSSIHVFRSGNDLRIYHDHYKSKSVFSYILSALLDSDGVDGPTMEPTACQTIALEEDPPERGYSASTFMESQRDGSAYIPVSMGYKVYRNSKRIRFSCVTLDDVHECSKLPRFQHRTEPISHCRLGGPHEPVYFEGGYMALFCGGDRKSLMLKLIVFLLRPVDGITSPAERTIVLPSDIDVESIRDVGFDEVSGILALRLGESPDIHLVHLV